MALLFWTSIRKSQMPGKLGSLALWLISFFAISTLLFANKYHRNVLTVTAGQSEDGGMLSPKSQDGSSKDYSKYTSSEQCFVSGLPG